MDHVASIAVRHPEMVAMGQHYGCAVQMEGASQFCAIRSYLSTAAKHDLAFFDALVQLTTGKPWIPAAA